MPKKRYFRIVLIILILAVAVVAVARLLRSHAGTDKPATKPNSKKSTKASGHPKLSSGFWKRAQAASKLYPASNAVAETPRPFVFGSDPLRFELLNQQSAKPDYRESSFLEHVRKDRDAFASHSADNVNTPATVPEPISLMAAALGVGLFIRRRRLHRDPR